MNVFENQLLLACRIRLYQPLALLMALASSATMAANSDFITALQASKVKNYALLNTLQVQMQGDVLEMYPAYFALSADLLLQTPDSIKAFAARYPQTALTEKLSGDYVEAKVKAGDYRDLVGLANLVVAPDDDEACAIAVAKDAAGDHSALQALKANVWLKTNNLSVLCNIAAKQMGTSLGLSQNEQLQRLWSLLRADRPYDAVQAATSMGLTLEETVLRSAGQNPSLYLEAAPVATFEQQAIWLYAIARLADKDLFAAEQAIALYQTSLPAMVQHYAYRLLAMSRLKTTVTQGFDTRVVPWFEKSEGAPFSDEEADAYARQAIRFGAWENVLRALDAMSPSKQEERLWKYWFARASEQRTDKNAKNLAHQFYTALAADNDYYGLLAKDRLGLNLSHLMADYTPTSADFERLNQDVYFTRAFTLRNLNVDATFSNREWNWAVRQALARKDDALLIAAASKAAQMVWYDRAIYAADRAKTLHSYALSYPTPYRDEVTSYSGQFGVDPAWAYGLTRQESRFIINARSNVGAGGLMQVMPATAKWIANRLGESYSSAKLSNMDANIRFGTFYLGHISRQLSNSAVLATAGYNAGPLRAKRWQPDNAPLSADQYTECIPFLETRDYVKNVMTNAVHYGVLMGQGTQSISARMSVIPTRTNVDIVGP